eukprot:353529-Chlamydomonas_euryale.AAC.8
MQPEGGRSTAQPAEGRSTAHGACTCSVEHQQCGERVACVGGVDLQQCAEGVWSWGSLLGQLLSLSGVPCMSATRTHRHRVALFAPFPLRRVPLPLRTSAAFFRSLCARSRRARVLRCSRTARASRRCACSSCADSALMPLSRLDELTSPLPREAVRARGSSRGGTHACHAACCRVLVRAACGRLSASGAYALTGSWNRRSGRWRASGPQVPGCAQTSRSGRWRASGPHGPPRIRCERTTGSGRWSRSAWASPDLRPGPDAQALRPH